MLLSYETARREGLLSLRKLSANDKIKSVVRNQRRLIENDYIYNETLKDLDLSFKEGNTSIKLFLSRILQAKQAVIERNYLSYMESAVAGNCEVTNSGCILDTNLFFDMFSSDDPPDRVTTTPTHRVIAYLRQYSPTLCTPDHGYWRDICSVEDDHTNYSADESEVVIAILDATVRSIQRNLDQSSLEMCAFTFITKASERLVFDLTESNVVANGAAPSLIFELAGTKYNGTNICTINFNICRKCVLYFNVYQI